MNEINRWLLSVPAFMVMLYCICSMISCGGENLACANIEEVQVCRPTDEAQECDCSEEALLYGDKGFIALMTAVEDSYDTIDTWPIICEMLGVEYGWSDEQMDGPTWTVNLFLVDDVENPYYAFYGWRVICRFEDDICTTTEHVMFWGLWTDTEDDQMRQLISRYVESIELI